MFEGSPNPRVFALPLGVDFAVELVAGLRARLGGQPPEAMARVQLLVNSHRMARRVEGVFLDGPPCLLPQIRVLTDVVDTPSLLDAAMPPRPGLDRLLLLAKLIADLLERVPDMAPRGAVFDLAESLAGLLDEMQDEGVSITALRDLDLGNMSAHWERARLFLDIAAGYEADSGTLDSAARLRHSVEALAKRWQNSPPRDPVVLAGSTASRGTTAVLMEAVARLPQGAVVLPGVDIDQPEDVWARLMSADGPQDHPQYRLAGVLNTLGLSTNDLRLWTDARPLAAERNALFSLALRPAPMTHQWLSEGPALPSLDKACEGVTLVEAPSPQLEAQAIALIMRHAVDEQKSIALITPDRALSRMVTALLRRWNLVPDDSAGRPLSLSPPGRLLRHVADGFGQKIDAEALIVVLKHPLTASGSDRGPHLLFTRRLELHLRRFGPAFPARADLLAWAEAQDDRPSTVPWAEWLAAWLDRLEGAIAPRPLAEWAMLLTNLAERISAGPTPDPNAPPLLWERDAGRKSRSLMTKLEQTVDSFGAFDLDDFTRLLDTQLAAEAARETDDPTPGLMIWGTIEARVQGADRVILGGLTEGIWPALPGADTWMNRQMRSQLGLTLPDRRIGLQAHDFQQAVASERVFLTRAKRDADAETVPARWLNRLTSLLSGLGAPGKDALAAMHARGANWLENAARIDLPTTRVEAAPRPMPAPPVPARPTVLSVTDVERLRRNAYAIYARRVLSLRDLSPLRPEADARLRGTLLHDAMASFTLATRDALPDALEAELMTHVDAELEKSGDLWPAIKHLWRARIKRIAPLFAEAEHARRAIAVPLRVEVDGEALTPTGVKLIARADRIDITSDGQLVIYDYKTGAPPTPKQIKYFNRQLPLEAAIAERGGFKDVPAATVASAHYLPMTKDLKPQSVTRDDDPLFIEDAWNALTELLQHYADPNQGYLSRGEARVRAEMDAYDHLARYLEWSESDQGKVIFVGREEER